MIVACLRFVPACYGCWSAEGTGCWGLYNYRASTGVANELTGHARWAAAIPGWQLRLNSETKCKLKGASTVFLEQCHNWSMIILIHKLYTLYFIMGTKVRGRMGVPTSGSICKPTQLFQFRNTVFFGGTSYSHCNMSESHHHLALHHSGWSSSTINRSCFWAIVTWTSSSATSNLVRSTLIIAIPIHCPWVFVVFFVCLWGCSCFLPAELASYHWNTCSRRALTPLKFMPWPTWCSTVINHDFQVA